MPVDPLRKVHTVLRRVRRRLFGVHARELKTLQDEVKGLQTLQNEVAALRALVSIDTEALKHTIAADRRQVQRLEELFIEGEARLAAVSRPTDIALSPIVSIIMPTHNRRELLLQAIESVRAQTLENWELVIIDDGSSDGTAEVLEGLKNDERIRFHRRAHGGAARARNEGLALARAPLIAYLDDDNLFFPDFLTAAVKRLAEDPTTSIVYGCLVTSSHHLCSTQLLWEPFDRDRLTRSNFIDLNTVVHRKSLFDKLGGFDEKLDRLIDWDLVLRYTAAAKAEPIPVLAARYRAMDANRLTETKAYGPSYFQIKKKLVRPPTQLPRVLYVVWHYPQLSESYVETEIRCMLRWGVHVEVWADSDVASPYPTSIPIHRGSLAAAIAQAAPDILHVHWLNSALRYREAIEASGLPVTIRMHGFEFTQESLEAAFGWRQVRAIYGFPHHAAIDPRIRMVSSAFDTQLFAPHPHKDRRLVVRTSAALPSKDLGGFFELAKKLPEHRFLLAAVTCKDRESYVEELRQLWRSSGTPAQLRIDVARDEIASLVGRAGIYLHTARIQGEEYATPIGMPISIAEAMATGCYLLVRNARPLNEYVGNAGRSYSDLEDAVEIIGETVSWSEREWFVAWRRSIDRAFTTHADELALRPIFKDWVDIRESRDGTLARDPRRSDPIALSTA